jgi:1,4-alpha-glucan branching enzyme
VAVRRLEPEQYGGIYFYNDWRSTTPWGNTRFDYGRPEVRNYILDNARRWLQQRFADGLRWDATGWIRNVYGNNNDPANDLPDGWSLMQAINDEIKKTQPWKISIAEDMQGNDWLSKDTSAGGAGFDAQWEAQFVHCVRSAIITADDSARDTYAVRDAMAYSYNNDAFQRVVYTESHDEDANGQSRVPEEIWPGNAGSYFSKKRSTLGAALVFTAPGIPMIFQGQEFLESGFFSDQKPLDWTKQQTFSGILAMYRDMIRLRRNWFNNTAGLQGQNLNVFHVSDEAKVIACHRWDQGGQGDDVVVVAKFIQPLLRFQLDWLPPRRPVEGSLQQRLEWLQPRLRQSTFLRYNRRSARRRQHALLRQRRHWPLHRHHPLAITSNAPGNGAWRRFNDIRRLWVPHPCAFVSSVCLGVAVSSHSNNVHA